MTRLFLRVDFDSERYIGPGRIQLLELVAQHGSIAQAAKAMDMSYKRAWYLLDAFGACFSEPLIVRQQGGKGGGSAQLTDFGRDVVERYRRMEALASQAIARELAPVEARLVKKKRRRSVQAA